jgi:hypothetical protein
MATFLCTWCCDLPEITAHYRCDRVIRTHRRRFFQRRILEDDDAISEPEETLVGLIDAEDNVVNTNKLRSEEESKYLTPYYQPVFIRETYRYPQSLIARLF